MNKTLSAAAFSLVALMLGLAGCTPSKEDQPPKPKVVGTLPKIGPAPAWHLQDLTGKPVNSDTLKGKVVVVDFWATWCGPCRAEIPGYKELQAQYGKDGLVIVGMSIDQNGPGAVREFAEKNGINYQIVMADDAVAAAFGGIESIPTTFLIDRSGQIRDRKDGMEEKSSYEAKILSVLKEPTGAGT